MYIPIFVINYTSSMFLTTIETFMFIFTGACPDNICIVYIVMNKQKYSCFRHCLLNMSLDLWRMPMLLKILLLAILMCYFQDKFSSMNTPKNFVTCSLLICIFSVRRLGKVYGDNCLFERG